MIIKKNQKIMAKRFNLISPEQILVLDEIFLVSL